MKKMNKKGFTIVELVIVIAVIAILAAVMIPTFSNVVSKAQTSAAIQQAKNDYTTYASNVDYKNGETAATAGYIKVDDVYVQVANGTLASVTQAEPTADYILIETDGSTQPVDKTP